MTEAPKDSWLELFAADGGGPVVDVPLRVMNRSGVPFLYLPTRNRAAAQALDLYPAQTLKARLAKSMLRLAFRFALQTHGRGTIFLLPQQDSLLAYLALTAGCPAGSLPEFAVLAGNPKAPGRRFVFLLFDVAGNPVAVVKAGGSAHACELIHHEATLLRECGGQCAGVPLLRDNFVSGKRAALAMDYVAGESPAGDCSSQLEKIFTAWLDQDAEVPLRKIPAWQRLAQTYDSETMPATIVSGGELRVRPTLMHGDFAPWNVKVAKESWTALDWERGERRGVPGWDWFHFVVQPAVLVRREMPEKTLQRLERLFASVEFIRFAKLAGIADREWPLTFAYLSYCLKVTQQTEGATRLASLMQAVQERVAVTTR